jgi:c-di-GMP-binding flagellar brake protein YcgR
VPASRPLIQTLIARKHARVEPLPNRPVEVQVMGATFLDVLLARDISQGGAAVMVSHGFTGCDLAATVQLIIKLPDRKAFMARGTVRHVSTQACLFGIEFTELSDTAKEQLTGYVKELTLLGRLR